MKSMVFLLGLGLLMLVGTVGCEEEHEHGYGYGGAYQGGYQGYGQGYGPGYYNGPLGNGNWHHD